MKLMSVKEYLETFYTEKSRPTRKKIIKFIKEGSIFGKKIGKCYYVDIDAEQKFTETLNAEI